MPCFCDSLLFATKTLVLPRGAFVSTPRMDLHATNFTIAARVLMDNTANRNIILGNWGSANNSWQMLFAIGAGGPGGHLQINLRRDMATNGSNPLQDLVTLESSAVVPAGQWHHVAVTWDWGADGAHPTCTLYLDGKVVGAQSPKIDTGVPGLRNPYTLMPTGNPYLIGRKEDGGDASAFFSGQMSDFKVFASALPGVEIERLAAGG